MNFLSLKIILIVFASILAVREIAAWNEIRPLKYILTPLVTMTVVFVPALSILQHGVSAYNMLVLTALLFALVADTILMIEGVSLLKYGMVYFLAGHVIYAAAFSMDFSFRPWNIAFIAFILVINFFHFRKLKANAGNMVPGIAVYVLAINTMLYLAVTGLNHGTDAGRLCAAAGAVLFAISDYIHSLNSFIKKIKHSTVYTWIFYAPAQLFIALSAFLR